MRRTRIRNALIVLAGAAVLVPVVVYGHRYARDLSEQQTCVNNLKTLSEACKMYQEDWHNVLVPYGVPFAWPPQGRMWPELLKSYMKESRDAKQGNAREHRFLAFVCPTPDPEDEDPCGFDRYYGINMECGGWMPKGKPVVVPMKSVKYPGSTIMIAEERWHAQGGSFFAAKPSDFDHKDPIVCHQFPERHMGKGNVLWIDGRVSSMTQAQYNMRDKGPYDGNIWLRLEGPKPPVP